MQLSHLYGVFFINVKINIYIFLYVKFCRFSDGYLLQKNTTYETRLQNLRWTSFA